METTQSQTRPRVGIIGIGMVGAQVARYFQEIRKLERKKKLFLYDIDPKKTYSDNINNAEVIFVCVPTPRAPDGACNLSAVHSVFSMIKDPKIVVLKSTVPPGTTERLQKQYPEHQLLFNPEFLTESQAWEDMIRPDRQIVGFTERSIDAAQFVLNLLPKAPFMSPWGSGYKRHMLTATEAELAKIFANAFFSMKVTFANHLADTCEALSANYENIKLALSADHRIGASHTDVHHGNYRGFGGYCLPKDLSAIIMFLKEIGMDTDLFEVVWKRNEMILARQGLTIDDVSGRVAPIINKNKADI